MTTITNPLFNFDNIDDFESTDIQERRSISFVTAKDIDEKGPGWELRGYFVSIKVSGKTDQKGNTLFAVEILTEDGSIHSMILGKDLEMKLNQFEFGDFVRIIYVKRERIANGNLMRVWDVKKYNQLKADIELLQSELTRLLPFAEAEEQQQFIAAPAEEVQSYVQPYQPPVVKTEPAKVSTRPAFLNKK